MNDEAVNFLDAIEDVPAASQGGDMVDGVNRSEFDEAGYLRLNPDVAEAVRSGEYSSGYQHYVRYGLREGRDLPGTPREPRDRLVPTEAARGHGAGGGEFRCWVERVTICDAGVMLAGWTNDTVSAIDCIRVISSNWRLVCDGGMLVRVRRQDVEAELGGTEQHPYGWFGFICASVPINTLLSCTVEIWLKSGAFAVMRSPMHVVSIFELRDQVPEPPRESEFLWPAGTGGHPGGGTWTW